jgi:tRNA uridine 5-carbamoylmethylation protein Kti12
MKVINLWGSPGAGKSTTAAGLFYKMKTAGYNVELVTEYVKDAVWDERTNLFKDQLYLLAQQNRRLERLRGKVDYAISDSPLLLVLAYSPKDYYNSFNGIVLDIWNSYDNYNYRLHRKHKYINEGRIHTEAEADLVDLKIDSIFTHYGQCYDNVFSDRDPAHEIFERIVNNDLPACAL